MHGEPENHTVLPCIDAEISPALFAGFCTMALMYMVFALCSGISLLALLWAGVTKKERSLVVHLLILSLTCLSRVVKSLFNCCLLPYHHVWYAILWSLSYAFETTALGLIRPQTLSSPTLLSPLLSCFRSFPTTGDGSGMFVVHWYLTLSLTKHGFRKEVIHSLFSVLLFRSFSFLPFLSCLLFSHLLL